MIISTSSYNIQLTRGIDIIATEALHHDLEPLQVDISSVEENVTAAIRHGSKRVKRALFETHVPPQHDRLEPN